MQKKSKVALVLFSLAALLIVGKVTFAAESNNTHDQMMNSNCMSSMMDMMGDKNMSKMMDAMNSSEGQEMMKSCNKFMDSYDTKEDQSDKTTEKEYPNPRKTSL
ncbi:hypothetical protein P9G84_02280 [Brevibacillus centrosporus]|uniref:hypothetical protein n=1 Tax=Brevibacillus centrosporus TaxID=54910 RepID=UPI0011444468|nr:hypothetical protein [Brevibacillus centrosporus]MEC2127820.1 hypothetical protein [Brevibacillus centrosporus]GED32060.1 hypothetical protein BCE02nite_32010 [Brevibacillus centrosporus]